MSEENRIQQADNNSQQLVYGESAMDQAGAALADTVAMPTGEGSSIVTLTGDLGVGKTTFCRGFLRACGHTGRVKSPTYPLLEEYQTVRGRVSHLDLYRLADPEELEFIGFRDLLVSGGLLLIEWPQRAPELRALASIEIDIRHRDEHSRLLTIRH